MQTVDLKIGEHNWRAHLRDEADQSVFNEIFRLDEYRAAKSAIQNAQDPIVDVGAHAGFFTMYCRALNDKVKIFAVEPEAENIRALKQHLKENKIKGVKVIAGALAAVSGKRQLLISDDSHNHFVIPSESRLSRDDEGSFRERTGILRYTQDDSKIANVQAFVFSDFCRQNKIKRISLLKIDIEGGEYELFAGMSEQDLSMVNFVILEYHTISPDFGAAEIADPRFCAKQNRDKQNKKQIEEKLRANGFGAQVFPSHFDKTMGFIFANNKRSP